MANQYCPKCKQFAVVTRHYKCGNNRRQISYCITVGCGMRTHATESHDLDFIRKLNGSAHRDEAYWVQPKLL